MYEKKEGIPMKVHNYPQGLTKAENLSVSINGVACNVYVNSVGYFVPLSYDEKIDVVIESDIEIDEVKISPAILKIDINKEKNRFSFSLNDKQHLFITIKGIELPLFFYGNAYPEPGEGATYYYKAGQIYEVGTLVLESNESVYIEEGAIVRGNIHSNKYAENIKIFGMGILDPSCNKDIDNNRTILMDCCTNVVIKDITIINTPSWNILLAGCQNVYIDNVKELGEVCGSDGVDIVGSSDVVIENCFFRNNDDCIAIKAFEGGFCDGDGNIVGNNAPSNWNRKVENILVQNCIFVNAMCGNGLEIGHELQIDEVSNIRFFNLDIVRSEGYGAAFAIHAGDHAMVRKVIFENIRVEHYSDFLIDFRVMHSRFNHDEERGQIRDILLKDIYVNQTSDNWGYTLSVIGGWDDKHTVENITFENFYLSEKKVMDSDVLELFTKNTKNIIYR